MSRNANRQHNPTIWSCVESPSRRSSALQCRRTGKRSEGLPASPIRLKIGRELWLRGSSCRVREFLQRKSGLLPHPEGRRAPFRRKRTSRRRRAGGIRHEPACDSICSTPAGPIPLPCRIPARLPCGLDRIGLRCGLWLRAHDLFVDRQHHAYGRALGRGCQLRGMEQLPRR